jgi:hypothetical protein
MQCRSFEMDTRCPRVGIHGCILLSYRKIGPMGPRERWRSMSSALMVPDIIMRSMTTRK